MAALGLVLFLLLVHHSHVRGGGETEKEKRETDIETRRECIRETDSLNRNTDRETDLKNKTGRKRGKPK